MHRGLAAEGGERAQPDVIPGRIVRAGKKGDSRTVRERKRVRVDRRWSSGVREREKNENHAGGRERARKIGDGDIGGGQEEGGRHSGRLPLCSL